MIHLIIDSCDDQQTLDTSLVRSDCDWLILFRAIDWKDFREGYCNSGGCLNLPGKLYGRIFSTNLENYTLFFHESC